MHSSQRIRLWADETVVNARPATEFAREFRDTRPDAEEAAPAPAPVPVPEAPAARSYDWLLWAIAALAGLVIALIITRMV